MNTLVTGTKTAAKTAGHHATLDAVTAWFGRRVHAVAPLKAQGVYDEDVFRTILRRERALAYRHGRYFSLLEVNMTNGNRNTAAMKTLASTLSERLRNTDVVGFSGAYSMAAIMPETPRSNAERVGQEICRHVAEHFTAPEYAVEVFPNEDLAGPADQDNGNDAHAGADTPADTPAASCQRVSRLARLGVPLWKRVLDVVVASLAIVLFSPIMLAVAILIKRVSPGPVFFRQERIGFLGRHFMLLKFRTMHLGADTGSHREHVVDLLKSDTPMQKLDASNDKRLIPLGRWIRAAAIDELPQLFNVLKGEMSLVGPRPPIAYEYDEYTLWHKRRCDTLPGLTGVWQVSGKNKINFSGMVRLDIGYAERKSLWTDLKTLVMTIPAVLAEVRQASGVEKGAIHEEAV